MSWTALGYFWTWLTYMIVSVPEMIFWFMSMSDSRMGHWLFNMWASYVGLYGSCILYFFSFLFPVIQMTAVVTPAWSQPGFVNALVQTLMMMLTWVFTSVVHVMGYSRLNRKFWREQ